MKNKIIVISTILGISLLIFIILTIILANNSFDPTAFDISVRDFFYDIRGNKGNAIFWISRIITELGNVYVIIGILLLVLIYTKGDNRFISFALGALLMILSNLFLKDIFQRLRPEEALRWVTENDLSYPSGHSTSTAFTYCFLAYLIHDSKFSKRNKIIGYILCATAIIFIPITRLIFGVHYITDIFGGLLCGIICASITILFYLFLKKYEIFKKPLFISIYELFKEDKKIEDKEEK